MRILGPINNPFFVKHGQTGLLMQFKKVSRGINLHIFHWMQDQLCYMTKGRVTSYSVLDL